MAFRVAPPQNNRHQGVKIGDCGLFCRVDPRQIELGITLAPLYHGRSYASEALQCVLDLVFSTMHVHRVTAVTDAANLPAASLFRRLGFRLEAHFLEHLWFKGQWTNEFVFAMLAREWMRLQEARLCRGNKASPS